eukprot:TRINITY_DN10638_c0_g1_i7.p1 TRINITY_DN10638_c0_g1~~TRINITY_DN10638_c0_g1_i7.p1  ORF type:complete len:526 (+),score=119.59 TRINITY_DN10638_c0_g1_i7:126-1703(+)
MWMPDTNYLLALPNANPRMLWLYWAAGLVLLLPFFILLAIVRKVLPSFGTVRRVWRLSVSSSDHYSKRWWQPLLGDHANIKNYSSFIARLTETALKTGPQLFWAGYEPHLMLTDPKDIRAVLTRPANEQHTSDRSANKLSARFFGKGILQACGEDWRRQHRIMYKAFNPLHLTNFRPAFVARAKQLVAKLSREAGNEVAIRTELSNLALGVMVDTNFGNTLSAQEQELFVQNINYFIEQNKNLWHQVPVLNRIMADGAALDRCFDSMYSLVEAAIRRRREGTSMDRATTDENLVSRPAIDLLLEAAQEVADDYVMDDITLRDNLLTLMGAGTETTATTMTWVLGFLSCYPEVYKSVMEENAGVDTDSLTDKGDLNQVVPYLTQVIYETLRMRPSVFVVPSRRLFRDTTLPSGIFVPNGLSTGVFQDIVHQDPKLWDNPKEFRPARFAPGNAKATDRRFTFLSFGSGNRFCLGKYMAIAEMQVVLTILLRHLKFEMPAGHDGLVPTLGGVVLIPSCTSMRVDTMTT